MYKPVIIWNNQKLKHNSFIPDLKIKEIVALYVTVEKNKTVSMYVAYLFTFSG